MLYLAAVLIVASVALFVAAPLGGGLLATRRAGRDAAEAERLEHERALAMQGCASWSSIARWASFPRPTTRRCARA